MVKVRLARGGAKKKPFYNIVATDSRKRRDSGYIEKIGFFNPVAQKNEVRLSLAIERLEYWQSQGAQLSDRVKQLAKEFKEPEKFAAKRQKKLDKKLANKQAKEKAKEQQKLEELKAQQEAENPEKQQEEKPTEEQPTEETQKEEETKE